MERIDTIIEGVLESLGDRRGALLPILHGVQAEMGHIPAEAVPAIARKLNLSRADVHGVISFYHDFRTEKSGRRSIHICQAESCQAMGGRALTSAAKTQLGIDFDETTSDGAFTLRPVYCLGNCAASPSVMIGEEVYGRVTPERLSRILGSETTGQS